MNLSMVSTDQWVFILHWMLGKIQIYSSVELCTDLQLSYVLLFFILWIHLLRISHNNTTSSFREPLDCRYFTQKSSKYLWGSERNVWIWEVFSFSQLQNCSHDQIIGFFS